MKICPSRYGEIKLQGKVQKSFCLFSGVLRVINLDAFKSLPHEALNYRFEVATVLLIEGIRMGKDRQASGFLDHTNSLSGQNLGFLHVCRRTFSKIQIEGILDLAHMASSDHDIGHVRSSGDSSAGFSGHFLNRKMHTTVAQFRQDLGNAILASLAQISQRFQQLRVIWTDEETQDVNYPRVPLDTHLHTGYDFHPCSESFRLSFSNARDRIVVCNRYCLKALFRRATDDLRRRQTPVGHVCMDV